MEITDLEADPEWGWVADILSRARQIMEKNSGSLEPMLFCRRPGHLTICPMGHIGDYATEEGKDLVAAAMRVACRQTQATSCVFVTDSWLTVVPEGDAAFQAALDASGRWAKLPDEVRRRARRREAIQVVMETLERPLPRGLMQFYRREAGDKIVFEELIPPAESGPLSGRFSRLLERPDVTLEMLAALHGEVEDLRESTIDDDGLVERFVRTWRSFGVPMGFALHVGDDRIDLLRADGSPFITVRRENRPEEFEKLKKACVELQEEQRRL